MRFDILTLFPEIFDSYFGESILGRAQEKRQITINAHQIRKYGLGKHKQVDDKPYGGGAGMVMMAEPILKALENVVKSGKRKVKSNEKTKVIIFSAKGKQFNQKMAVDWAKKYDRIIFINGRYEGIDERVKTITKAEEISIGPYVMTDGDVASMVVVSAVARLLPGVISSESLAEESHSINYKLQTKNLTEYPHYTRPEILEYQGKKYRVPKVLLSGDHKKIAEWRKSKQQ
jgi:tRNA (guanine37-N1)-methyltransferase